MTKLPLSIYKVFFELSCMLILETSNAVESLHSRIYSGCDITKGSQRFGIMEGLQRLFLYCDNVRRSYILALGKITLFMKWIIH